MPRNKTFKYDEKIDALIGPAVEKVLGRVVKNVVKMKQGEVNHVYKIITTKTPLLARVFQYSAWPEPGQLQWIESQLSKHKIPHAKILYYNRGAKFFPHGFMITEFIEGLNGNRAVSLHKMPLPRIFLETGKILKQVHAIKVKKYGSIKYGKGEVKDYLKFKLKQVKNQLGNLYKNKAIERNLYPEISIKLKQGLGSFKNKFFPVLTHSDANRDNMIISRTGKLILVDWDNASAQIWLDDYAELTYWTDWKRNPKAAKQRHELITKNFFKGYGRHNFSPAQIIKIEKCLHIIKAVNMMDYYYHIKQSIQEFKKTKLKLLMLLK